MQSTTDLFIGKIAADYRVILLGGLAVIAHGLSRSTMDADVWLEPMDSAGTWFNEESMVWATQGWTVRPNH
jgi:hypothetical protein